MFNDNYAWRTLNISFFYISTTRRNDTQRQRKSESTSRIPIMVDELTNDEDTHIIQGKKEKIGKKKRKKEK